MKSGTAIRSKATLWVLAALVVAAMLGLTGYWFQESLLAGVEPPYHGVGQAVRMLAVLLSPMSIFAWINAAAWILCRLHRPKTATEQAGRSVTEAAFA